MKFLRKAFPHAVAILIFMAVSAIFFAPQFEGKALRQGDMVQVSGMNRDIVLHKEQHGEHPQWAGNMFSGMPAYLIDMNYDGRYVKQVADWAYFLGHPASYLFLAMAGFYLMLLMFGVNPWIAIFGGVAYGLSSYFPIIIEAGHITKMMALCWVAPLIGSIYYAYHRKRLLGALLAGIFASIEISTSHPQITYYFMFAIVGLLAVEIVRAWKERLWGPFLKTSLALMGAAVLAVGSNFVQLYYVADYSGDSTRGRSELSATATSNATSGLDKDYAMAWSYGKGETFNLFIPNFMGGSSHGGFAADGPVAQSLKPYQAQSIATQLPGYWGDQSFTSGPVYLGAVVVFIFVLGLFVVRGARLWWLIGVSVLALLLAWGHNLAWVSHLFLDYFPLYNKFRTVSMILVLVQWAVPLLGVFALSDIISGKVEPRRLNRSLYWSAGIAGGFALFAAFILPNFLEFTAMQDGAMGLPEDVMSAMRAERAMLLRSDALRSLMFVLAAAAVLWIYTKGWIKATGMALIVAALTLVDLYSVDRRFVKPEDFKPVRVANAIAMTEADKQILQDKTNYRVANFAVSPFNDATTSYYHRSVGGYHAAKLRRYQDLIDYHLSKQNMAVYSMLNTKYFITQEGVSENPDAAGNAWFVEQVELVDNPNQEIEALESVGWNPRHRAFVDKRFSAQLDGRTQPMRDSSASIQLTDYKVNHLTYRSRAAADQVAVFSEIYYDKGWKAYIDGVEVPYFRANYVLRAMNVPAGEHTIEWRFSAPHYALVLGITQVCSLILLLGALVLIVIDVVRAARNKVGTAA